MRSLFVVLAFVAIALTSTEASAGIVQISGFHSWAEIKGACEKAGGTFFNHDDGGYGCATKCKGGTCQVACTPDGKCKGDVPDKKAPSRMDVLGVLKFSSAGPTPPPLSRGTDGVIRTGAGLCLDAHASDMAKNGGRVQVWSCNGQPQQRWTYDRATSAIRVSSGLCLDVHAAEMTMNGWRVQVWACNGQVQQQWTPMPGGAIRSNRSGLCLDVHAPDQSINGGRVQVWQCSGAQQQRFTSNGF